MIIQSACLLIFFKLNIYVLPIMFTIECRVVISIWKCSHIFFKHVSLQCLLFDICVHWKYSYGIWAISRYHTIFDTFSLKYEYLIMYNSMRLIKGLSGLYSRLSFSLILYYPSWTMVFGLSSNKLLGRMLYIK